MEKKEKLLIPKMDVVFRALFREDTKDLLSKLISDVLKEEIKVVTTDKSRHVNIEEANEKLGIMDLRAELEGGKQCNIEIQLRPHKGENERILYYWADAYRRQIRVGEYYKKLKKTISIIILDHEIEELKGMEKLGIKWQIRDEESGKRVLTDRLEIVILEIPKAKRLYKRGERNEIIEWLMFMDNPNNKEVEEIMDYNKAIKKAAEELEQVSGDEHLRYIAELKLKGIMDEAAAMDYAEEHGYNAGFERGEKEGFEKGEKEGVKEGIKEGIKKNRIETARNMLKENIDKDIIMKVTGLSEEEIEKIINNT